MPVPKRKKSSKKELIVKKASAMFRQKGFPASSMRDLAEEIGLEAASLYNHIQSKSEILEEIIFRTADECLSHLESLDEENTSSTDKIESLIRFHIRMMLNRFDDYYVMTNEWIHLREPHLSNFTGKRRYYVQKMESIIEEGIRNKAMKPGMPYTAMLTILASVRGLEFWHRSAKKISPQVMEDNMVTLLTNGLNK
ncbi:MAG TPA: TetR/AcrR family transcriptional regulator [Chitinophagaceae bacterium]|nr:TetR/AcrR family transcriptional regulator [Chitinophagaceae bacterium]